MLNGVGRVGLVSVETFLIGGYYCHLRILYFVPTILTRSSQIQLTRNAVSDPASFCHCSSFLNKYKIVL